jgi:hypothetical protein
VICSEGLKLEPLCRWGDALCVVSATLFGVHKYRSEIVTAEVRRTADKRYRNFCWRSPSTRLPARMALFQR